MNAVLRNPSPSSGAVAVSAALALPATASATVTVNAAGDPITFTGDDAADNLVLTVSGGKIAHNLPPRRASRPRPIWTRTRRTPRSETWRAPTSSIRGGGGADILNAAGLGNTYNSLDIQGDAGDDTITGGGKADPLAGGEGDDRVVGGPGNDTMTGGNGNDVLGLEQRRRLGHDGRGRRQRRDRGQRGGQRRRRLPDHPGRERQDDVRAGEPGPVHPQHARRADDGQRAGRRRHHHRRPRTRRAASC